MESLVSALSRAIVQQRPDSREATSPINDAHRARVEGLLTEARNHGCRVIDHGNHAPALVIDPTQTLSVMHEEVFGRALPVIGVKNMEAAIGFVNARPHALVVYAFTNDKTLQTRLLQQTRSGALVFNETLLHHAVPTLPFGGIGESGMGAYHGRHGFERFSHLRGVFYQNETRYQQNFAAALPALAYETASFTLKLIH